jgi:indolepyruvate ferredoxin oxidoreductase alpha subunit
MKRLLSGNEAVARGAWEAGAVVGSAYPGTPSTEIMETFALFPGVYAEWATNEKVALDVVVGAAYAGRRAFTAMKHVGLNVAADVLFYVSMTGIEAGLVIVSADDPSMHSSQNEQDNRQYARFARIPCLDPSDSQEAHDFMITAFTLSEQFDTPVMLRMTTRVCHTSSPVEVSEERMTISAERKYPRNPGKYIMVPANARRHHAWIEDRMIKISRFSETFSGNRVEMRSAHLGIITGGIAYQYAREVFPEASILKLGMVYPLPVEMIRNFANSVEKLIVLEELDPFIEEQVRLMGVEVFGSRPTEYPANKSIFPVVGELDPFVVFHSAVAAGLLPRSQGDEVRWKEEKREIRFVDIPDRPPVLCPGCPHRGAFYVLHKLGLPVNGDIGCYTLGMTSPLNAMDTCGCMGASVGVAHGAAVAGDAERHVAVMGDSTFFHTGMPALLNVAYNQSDVLTIIMDNRVTGMTGHQDNPGTGKTLQGKETVAVEIEPIVQAMGITRVKTVKGYDVKEIERTIKGWLKMKGPAVLITREECALLPSARKRWIPLRVIPGLCNGCTLCFRVGCPAISQSPEMDPVHQRPLAQIDPLLCTGCEICAQICPRNAILFRSQVEMETSGDEYAPH